MPWRQNLVCTVSASTRSLQASSPPRGWGSNYLSKRMGPHAKLHAHRCGGWVCQQTWPKLQSSWRVMMLLISLGRPSWSMAARWRCGKACERRLSDWRDGVASARAGHSQPTLDYKTFPEASLRYMPGGRRRVYTHAKGGHTPHPAGYEHGSARSEPRRRRWRVPPRAKWLREPPVAATRKSASIA